MYSQFQRATSSKGSEQEFLKHTSPVTLFSEKMWGGGAFIRTGAFIRIKMVVLNMAKFIRVL